MALAESLAESTCRGAAGGPTHCARVVESLQRRRGRQAGRGGRRGVLAGAPRLSPPDHLPTSAGRLQYGARDVQLRQQAARRPATGATWLAPRVTAGETEVDRPIPGFVLVI